MVTRITNGMLTSKLMSNLYLNLGNVDNLQNQLASGKKWAHISDDPSALIFGQAARNKLARLSHYQETVGTAKNWLMQSESGVMELQKMVGNIYEELINAGGPKTIMDRQNIGKMVEQMQQHYLDTLNASFGDRFVFAGYNTPGDYVQGNNVNIKPFTIEDDGDLYFNGFNVSQFDKMPAEFLLNDLSGLDPAGNPADAAYINGLAGSWLGSADNVNGITAEDLVKFHKLKNDVLSLDVGPGISMPVTQNGLDILFFAATAKDENENTISRNMYELLKEVKDAINGDLLGADGEPLTVLDGTEIEGLTKFIKLLQDGQNHLLVKTAEIGGKDRRLELLEARYEGDEINYSTMRSDAEDADIAEVIMNLRIAETVYQAALSAGARVIQPTLMDFLR